MADGHDNIVETLRSRLLRGLQVGTLVAGDRLPSARDLVEEFSVDHRIILSAYRQLSEEGLIEIRERGGVYVRPTNGASAYGASIPETWVADILAEGFARGIPGPELPAWLRRCVETVRIRAAVLTETDDQASGLARELRDDFGMAAEGFNIRVAREDAEFPAAVRDADLLVTTSAHAQTVEQTAKSLRKSFLCIEVRADLVAGELALLLRKPVWAVVATPEFGTLLRNFFGKVPGIENLNVVVYGRDDTTAIPSDAPVYVTQRVRETVGVDSISGRILPPTRTISPDSARAIFELIAGINMRAWHAMQRS